MARGNTNRGIAVVVILYVWLFAILPGCGGGISGTGGLVFSGTVSGVDGKARLGVVVTMVQTGASDTTDDNGEFEIVTEVSAPIVIIAFASNEVDSSIEIESFPNDASGAIVDVVIDELRSEIASTNIQIIRDEPGSEAPDDSIVEPLPQVPSTPPPSVGDICTALFDPVCGVDGLTYGNECEASRSGVEIAHRGECDDTDVSLPVPVSEPEDSVCVQVVVCGSDGNLYPTPCAAEEAGVIVVPDEECNSSDEFACAQVIVCGDDGNFYSTPCDAQDAGVIIVPDEECMMPAEGEFGITAIM